MITKHSLALAENIAVAIPGEGLVRETDLLGSLNSVSYGLTPYNEDFRGQVVDVTANVTEHTAVMQLGTQRMGEIVRGALDMVKDYGVPLAHAICKGLNVGYTGNALYYLATQKTSVTYTNIDDPFFESQIYPTEGQIRNTALSFQSVSLAALSRLSFQFASATKIIEFVDSKHPDVLAVLNDNDEDLGIAFERLTDLKELTKLFAVTGGNVLDFTKSQGVNINLLLKMYVIVGRMYLSDKPFMLEDGSLKDYREFVDLMYNGLTVYLIRLKKLVDMYRARGLVLRNEKAPAIVEHTDSGTGQKLFLLSFEASAFYTNEVIALAEANGVSLNDAVFAAMYSTANGIPVATLDLVKDKAKVDALMRNYHDKIDLVMTRKAKEIFTTSAVNAATKFVNERPEIRQALSANLGAERAMTATLITTHLGLELERFYARFSTTAPQGGDAPVAEEAETERALECLFQTHLIPTFLRMLGCDLAAEIIEHTYVTQQVEDNVKDKRERLHVALIEVIASKLVQA